MEKFDIAPFVLPNCVPGEVRFEEPRDVESLRLRFRGPVPRTLGIQYLQSRWPNARFEKHRDLEDPASFGWIPVDDQWNGTWCTARASRSVAGDVATVTFRPLTAAEVQDLEPGYGVTFRRSLAFRIVVPDPGRIAVIRILTRSRPAKSSLRVLLDAGRRTAGRSIRVSAYNARILRVRPETGSRASGDVVSLASSGRRCFLVDLRHMAPEHPYCGDDALVTFALDRDAFTVRLRDLDEPVWNADEGIYVTREPDACTYREYRSRHEGARTTIQQVADQPEQSFAGAFYGQPRGHAVNYTLGCAHSPQRFWLEANGDLLLHKGNLDFFGRKPEHARRFLNKGIARFFFGFERWLASARYDGPAPAPIYSLRFRREAVSVEESALCVPLLRSIHDGPLAYEEPVAALIRFRFTHQGDAPTEAVLPLRYANESARSQNALFFDPVMNDYLVPRTASDEVRLEDGMVSSRYEGSLVVRAAWTSDTLRPTVLADGSAALGCTLEPGRSAEVLLKVPFVSLSDPREREALLGLDYDASFHEVVDYWQKDGRRGCQLQTPVPHLDAVHACHPAHVRISDIAMPGDPGLLNTSVGSSSYGNFANEACMVIQELDQRGLGGEVESRLDLFIRYAGTAKQPGNFTDFEGSFYGAGGWECGDYNQHHGWVLWYLAEHFLLTRDRAWFARVADAVIAGADWVFRQRRNTMGDLPHSRGWERGFLAAGSLEDVTDFCYWLSTNCFTWRGTDTAARALEAFGHPRAPRVRLESDAYGADLRMGFETARRQAPLVKLRDGRWVPQYPSRLYCRGRDRGWIRTLLEGPVNLLISGLYESGSRQAGWILDDLQDNLYHTPPNGYVLRNPRKLLCHRGGFSIQPNLLAGLMPHLERDEIEVFLWMFFNAWAACFREEVSGMIEHPLPELGFSNPTTFKTSDEANAVMWLRSIVVHSTPRCLHLGKAIPRAWLAHGEEVRISGARTHHGTVSARWRSDLAHGTITLDAELESLPDAPRVLARFRHPAKAPIRAVTVNGGTWSAFDPATEDVDLTGMRGALRIVVEYGTR